MTEPTRAAESLSRPSILVTGDVVRDVYVYQGDRVFPAQQGRIAPFLSDRPGGSKGLHELLSAARPGTVDFGLDEPLPLKDLQPVYTLWKPCEGDTKDVHQKAAKGSPIPKVWRVGQALGYALGAPKLVALRRSAAAETRHTVVVIDDAGLSFRTLPAKVSWPVGVSKDDPQPGWIIHKMACPIAQGDLWRELIGAQQPARRCNLIVIVAADELRRAGAAISRGVSWERTVSELCSELNDNPAFQPLLNYTRRLMVSFGCVGTVWFDASCDQKREGALAEDRATLVYDPSLPEGDWKTLLQDDHAVYGNLNTFTAAIALGMADHAPQIPPDLSGAAQRAMVACRQLRFLGHGVVSAASPGPPLEELARLISPEPVQSEPVTDVWDRLVPSGFEIVFGTDGRMNARSAATWTLAALAENPASQPDLPLYGLAHRVALYGLCALRHIPRASFGALLSVDRDEMETLRSLTQLIRNYEKEKQPKQPLTIAAFGPPGAGKSFGIIEIAKQILGSDVPILTFNLSQFDSPSELFGAFHQVRDKALKGLIPVVFWDEFDSRNYQWLQYLLAPMQDGAFVQDGHTHNIGKCLFVFAGATSWDFEHFGPAPMPDGVRFSDVARKSAEPALTPGHNAPEYKTPVTGLVEFYGLHQERMKADQAASDEFRQKKGPDFLSRLDAHINVLGPNRRMLYEWSTRTWGIPDERDITFPLRRAILLRQFLGAKKPEDKLDIDRDLLRAFLHVPRYRHGARSLEKIARHLALSHAPFRRANLPPPQVLEQHLDSAGEFDRVYQDTQRLLTPAAVEVLADAINEGYNHDNPAAWNQPFTSLDPFLQQSNRAAALRIPRILALAGLCLVRRATALAHPSLDLPLTPEEQLAGDHIEHHIEVLAEEEHNLWVQFHEENGWTFGFKMKPGATATHPDEPAVPFEKDKATLKHPCLKPFNEMPDDHGQRRTWQDYDRNAVSRYPRVLRLTEFMIAVVES